MTKVIHIKQHIQKIVSLVNVHSYVRYFSYFVVLKLYSMCTHPLLFLMEITVFCILLNISF